MLHDAAVAKTEVAEECPDNLAANACCIAAAPAINIL
jgi:hypothetical protein